MLAGFTGLLKRRSSSAGAGFIDANVEFAPMNNSPDQADRVGRVQTM
jgi:hypothetical protein